MQGGRAGYLKPFSLRHQILIIGTLVISIWQMARHLIDYAVGSVGPGWHVGHEQISRSTSRVGPLTLGPCTALSRTIKA